MLSQVIIRAATDHDIESIQSIYAYHVLNGLGTFEEVPPTIIEMKSRLHNIQLLNYLFLVAEIKQQVVGYCYTNYYRQRSAYRYMVEDSIFVAHNYQGQKIGQILLTELIKQSKQQKFSQMIAVIGDSNNMGSINLHKKLGFAITGKLNKAGFKFNQWVDVVLMQLEL